MTDPVRRRARGSAEIAAALDAGEPVAAVFVTRAAAAAAADLLGRVRAAGGVVHVVGEGVLRRFADGEPVAAVVGPSARADAGGLLARGGAAWLLCGVGYASNVGAAIRTAEVAGAAGVIVDAGLAAAERRTALRASMRADRVMPVVFAGASEALDAAERVGARVVALESTGAGAPWETDLTGDVLLVAGGEREGVPREVLARAGRVVRVPMAGFIPSYNVQAAVAAVAAERLRQTALRATSALRGTSRRS